MKKAEMIARYGQEYYDAFLARQIAHRKTPEGRAKWAAYMKSWHTKTSCRQPTLHDLQESCDELSDALEMRRNTPARIVRSSQPSSWPYYITDSTGFEDRST